MCVNGAALLEGAVLRYVVCVLSNAANATFSPLQICQCDRRLDASGRFVHKTSLRMTVRNERHTGIVLVIPQTCARLWNVCYA